MQLMRAQGATEYLVLLAVVLIIALVGIALLGFFPGTASDAQISQSQIYWKSASPVSITESGARANFIEAYTYLYLRLKNSGPYPLRITGIVGADGVKATQFWSGDCTPGVSSISDYFYLAPGEEKYIARYFGTACTVSIRATKGSTGGSQLGGASSICQNSTASPGTLDYKSLGFEYIQYMEGQQVTKREIGREFIVKCLQPQ